MSNGQDDTAAAAAADDEYNGNNESYLRINERVTDEKNKTPQLLQGDVLLAFSRRDKSSPCNYFLAHSPRLARNGGGSRFWDASPTRAGNCS